jgi:hypothetical protein
MAYDTLTGEYVIIIRECLIPTDEGDQPGYEIECRDMTHGAFRWPSELRFD